MYNETIELISGAAEKKVKFLNKSKMKYFIAAFLAGMYIGLAIILIYTIGGLTSDFPYYKVLMGVSFGIALSLVMLVGAELFTGNNMVGVGAVLNKRIKIKDVLLLWTVSYFGNLAGSIMTAVIYVLSHAGNKEVTEFMVKSAAAKISGTPVELFFRGLLCNLLVCLAVLSAIKLKEETAKLIMIFWCLFAFITSGYEHSIANMTLLMIGILVSGAAKITIAGYVYNLLFVTLGNIAGGGLLGVGYYLLGRNDKNEI
ncbi:formate/nitrite transporter family protein [Leptotrichia sp. OH3620_COT-345]|uniref:formate/nitrite transporter family protein n=1 Tax=Leptotrichia sp. OH3620_COT-345 TaxID=2491048 RepID=UPI000F6500D7|nr:formate/nitrite transporter family protein [Leptotrichia sp. OH3620_COT-345]RRD38990.1 formate/nitrite transporter family protein [Leptotrichia sp. OH3620_COT-345]